MPLKKDILHEMLNKQRKCINKKLSYNDMARIVKHINKSIFGEECTLWDGYVTNINNNVKSQYVNFYFKDRKVALHRLLYVNFVGDIADNEYIKYKCENKGICCNVNHLNKFDNDEKQIDDIKDYIIDNPDFSESEEDNLKEKEKEKELDFRVIFD
jgi:hypothetical protein